MANHEQLEILRQGVEKWNTWRRSNPFLVPNLRCADLHSANLSEADLGRVELVGSDLSEAKLTHAHLRNANLKEASLWRADLHDASLVGAVLTGVNIRDANFSGADLTDANLSKAGFLGTNLGWANLTNADLSYARVGATLFSGLDLSTVKGLETIEHTGRSYISVDTFYLSKGKIPERFLRGCGVPETLITYMPSFLDQAIQFYSCFISYSHADKAFARLIHDRLQGEGIRCWLDEHQLNPGDPLHPTIYQAIRVYDKVLLCCSETALTSWWVEKEFNRAIQKEQDYGVPVLVPLNLDAYLFSMTCTGWIADEIRQRFVADFTHWRDHDTFEISVQSIVKALRIDGGKASPPVPRLKPRNH